VQDLPHGDVIQEVTTSSSFSVINRHRYVVSVRATAENLVSHKYTVTKGIALNCKSGESFSQAAKIE
jgi:hypothetical protein